MPCESYLSEDVRLAEFVYLVFTCMPGESYLSEDVPLAEFVYLVFTCMPGESYCRRLGVFVVVSV